MSTRGPGRPPVDEVQKLSERYMIRFTPQQMQAIWHCGATAAEYRKCLYEFAQRRLKNLKEQQ